MSTKILRPRDVAAHLGVARATVYRLVERGELPSPIRITAGASGWLARDIDEYVARRVTASRGECLPREPGPEK